MSVTTEILSAYRDPQRTMDRQIELGAGEERALAYLLMALVLTFIARMPKLVQLHADPVNNILSLPAFIAGNFVSAVVFAALFLYGFAALSHLIARVFGGSGSWFGARISLFWSLLVLSPLVLLMGAIDAVFGPHLFTTLVSLAVGGMFLRIWLMSLAAMEWPRP